MRSHHSFDRRLSTYYLSVNRNKKSFALDLSSEKGRNIAKSLATNWADVVVENFKPGTMKKMGLDYDDLKVHSIHDIARFVR